MTKMQNQIIKCLGKKIKFTLMNIEKNWILHNLFLNDKPIKVFIAWLLETRKY